MKMKIRRRDEDKNRTREREKHVTNAQLMCLRVNNKIISTEREKKSALKQILTHHQHVTANEMLSAIPGKPYKLFVSLYQLIFQLLLYCPLLIFILIFIFIPLSLSLSFFLLIFNSLAFFSSPSIDHYHYITFIDISYQLNCYHLFQPMPRPTHTHTQSIPLIIYCDPMSLKKSSY